MYQEKLIIFKRVKPFLPFPLSTSGFFFYFSLVEIIGVFFVPNYTNLSESVFKGVLIVLISLVNFLLNKKVRLFKSIGTLEIVESKFVLKDLNGTVQQLLPFETIRKIYVVEGIPSGIMGLSDNYQTYDVEITLSDGQTISVECETFGKRALDTVSLPEFMTSVQSKIPD